MPPDSPVASVALSVPPPDTVAEAPKPLAGNVARPVPGPAVMAGIV